MGTTGRQVPDPRGRILKICATVKNIAVSGE